MDTISQMLDNHNKDSFESTEDNSVSSTTDNDTTCPSIKTPQTMEDRVREEIESCYTEAPDTIQEIIQLDQIHVSINGSFKRVHGKCKYNQNKNGEYRKHEYHIQIAKNCILNNANWRDTVRHEFAHAIAYEKHGTSQKHNENWKQICRMINAEPTRCASQKHTEPSYQYACPNECWTSGKHKRSKKIQKPWRKICAQCNEQCVSFDTGEPVPDTPGTVYVYK